MANLILLLRKPRHLAWTIRPKQFAPAVHEECSILALAAILAKSEPSWIAWANRKDKISTSVVRIADGLSPRQVSPGSLASNERKVVLIPDLLLAWRMATSAGRTIRRQIGAAAGKQQTLLVSRIPA